jgi:hypothetical protein
MTDTVAGRRSGTRTRSLEPRRRNEPAVPSVLWGAEDLLRWVITVGLGGIVVTVSWYVCAGDTQFSQQVGPTDAAIAGLLLSGIGNLAWLLHGRRALGERRRSLLSDVAVGGLDQPTPVGTRRRLGSTPQTESPVAPTAEETLFVAGEGMQRFHRPDCALAAGRTSWSASPRHEHEVAGRQPCGVCRP